MLTKQPFLKFKFQTAQITHTHCPHFSTTKDDTREAPDLSPQIADDNDKRGNDPKMSSTSSTRAQLATSYS